MRGWAGPVTEISVFATEISVTGKKIFPYEHSSPVTGTKLSKQNSFSLTTWRPTKWHSFDLVSISTLEVCELALLVKLQGSRKLWKLQTIQIYVPPFWLCFLNHPGWPGWNFPYEHTTEFVPVTKPAPLPGSYEEALSSIQSHVVAGCALFVNLQLHNFAREQDERKNHSSDFTSLTSQFLFIDESSEDERATRILWELTLK